VRRAILALFTVLALLMTFASPVAADTAPAGSGTFTSLSSYSTDCVPQGARTTCTENWVEVSSDQTVVSVCVGLYKYTYSDKTGRGRQISNENGCSDTTDPSILAMTISRDLITVSLAPTSITLAECARRTCTVTRTVMVSADASGGPVGTYTTRSTSRDGTCTYRYTETASYASVSGTLTIGSETVPTAGDAQQSEVKVQETCK
jgi:hypothetical protein